MTPGASPLNSGPRADAGFRETRWRRWGLVLLAGLVLGAFWVSAQWRSGRRFRGGGESGATGHERTAREVPYHSTETPTWTNAPGFEHDVFTFSRICYESGGWGGGHGGWGTDLPDSDLNLSYRLQQMTSMKVDPDGRILHLTDTDLPQYPFIYIVEPGRLYFSDAEAAALRAYLLNGGFLMLDDFWGDEEWANCESKMKQVFPDRSFEELPPDHPLYHGVFEIREKGQVPNVMTGRDSQYTGVTWEENHFGDVRTVHHRGITDDKGRLMVLATHNTDNGDGWEREGEDDYYFHNFSEKIAYPLGINIVFYVMTH
ncbi:MAG: DUF4159 domain-containing protein [Verrucomicrobiae bacterium]|nr:DUF4159 domain-containing protein [Verrucomicrobiae bacterium]